MSRLHGKLVIATHNAGKLREIAALLAPYGVECISAGDLDLEEPEEIHDTFIENALLKARAATEATGLPALADDSGLCVEALGAAPASTPPTGPSGTGTKAPTGATGTWPWARSRAAVRTGPGCGPRCAFRLRSGDHLARRRACGL
jgi:hypothetical protein